MPMMIWIKEDFNPERFFGDNITFSFVCDTHLVNKSQRLGGRSNRYFVSLDTSDINRIMAGSNTESAEKYGWHTYWIITESTVCVPTQIWPSEMRMEGLEDHSQLYENYATDSNVIEGAFEDNFKEMSPDEIR